MRLTVACLMLAPIAWVNVIRNAPRTVGKQSEETCDATFQVTLWGAIGLLSTLVLYANWGDL